MIQTRLIENAHNDLVTDVSYDFYGLHLATCGIDHRIKIWSLDEATGSWNVEDDWKAHDAAVTKVSWAHPEFGPIIASSSFDRTVKIWEQIVGEHEQQLNGNASSSSNSRWVERAVLVDAKGSVRAVEFAPRHFGLKLAAISTDNHLRIYECLEQPSLSTWQIAEEVDVFALSYVPQRLASSINSHATATPTQTTATLDSSKLHSTLLAQTQQSIQPPNRPGMGSKEADGGWCISWCKDRYWGEVIAVGCSISGVVKIIQFSPSRRPQTLLTLENLPSKPAGTTSNASVPRTSASAGGPSLSAASSRETIYAVTSVSWAPSCGRSFHLVATGSRDGKVRIWKLRPPLPLEDQDPAFESPDEKWTSALVAEFDDHGSVVGRVEWNVTGTILSSAGNDGRVRLWKQTIGGIWRAAGQLSVEQAEPDTEDNDVAMDENVVAG